MNSGYLCSFCKISKAAKRQRLIFNPEIHPSRLEEFLGLLLGQNVKILRVMPSESSRLTAEGSLLVMDILVLLESGELVNVEIQRVGYLFPGARCACYSSDLVMRQYSQVREACRRRHEDFSYRDIKKVYTIVLIEESTSEFRKYPKEYLHYGKQTFNTGLELDMIQEYLPGVFHEEIKRTEQSCSESQIKGCTHTI